MALARTKKTNQGGRAKAGKAARPAKAGVKKGGGRFVLTVGDEGAILIYMQGVKVVRRLFAPSVQPSHTEAIREIMQQNPKVPVYLLADVMDQQYVPQTFPPVSQLSVGGLVKRRLDRDFAPDDLKAALPIGREKGGRKEWKYLLIGLTKTELMNGWIDLLTEMPNPMKGVYLAPVEAVNYVNMLQRRLGGAKPRPWQLFISYNKVSGFRQVVLQDGKLVFTRVSQAMDDAVAAVLAGNVEQEILNTLEYMKRLQFQSNADLDATIVISQDVAESIDANRFGFASAHVLSPLQVADTLGLEQAALSADRFGDVVMASAFGIAKKPVLRFSTAYINKLESLYKAGTAIRTVAALAVVALLGLTAMTGLEMFQNYSAIGTATKKVQGLQSELKEAQASVNGLNQDVAFKAAVVAAYEAYMKNAPVPKDIAGKLMPFVTPQTRIANISWNYDAGPDAPVAPGPGAVPTPVAVKVEFDLSATAPTVEALNQVGKNLMESLKGALPDFEITTPPFPWLKEEPKQEEITRDQSQAITVSAQNMIIVVTISGPKQKPAVPTPDAMPQGMAQ